MDHLITQAKEQFDQILSYVQGSAQHQQLHEVEKGIFYALLKLGLTLLVMFFHQKGIGQKGKIHIDNKNVKRPYHSVKQKEYLSIFGRVSIPRACYWAKGRHEIYPLDAELNIPNTEYSYVLQEWSASLGAEQPYEKAANLEQKHANEQNDGKLGKKKMSTVIGVYTIDPHERTAESFLSKEKGKRPHPCNKVIQATLDGKETAVQRLKKEIEKRDPKKEKQCVALVDGEHKLRELFKVYLPWFTIIIDIYHVMEYLWKGAHVFHKEGSAEAASWMTDKLTKLLLGKVEGIIAELKELLSSLSAGKQDLLQKTITYLENGKEFMRYDIYLTKGYPIGSGVVEGACKNLVKDRMEQCGMRWTIAGAESVLSMRSIQINKMTGDYWKYHIAQERNRLYGTLAANEMAELAA